MDRSKQVNLFGQPVEFFRNLITGAVENQRLHIKEDVEFYLVTLLTKYMRGAELKRSSEDPLAIKLQKSMMVEKMESIQLLKDMGDFALYVSGFFPDSFKRKLIDIDYYMAMGGLAYHRLANSLTEQALQSLYSDLHKGFGTYVDVLAEVSEQAFSHTDQDMLRLYEKWIQTKSQRLQKKLIQEGLIPVDITKVYPQ